MGCDTKHSNVVSMDCYLEVQEGTTRQKIMQEFGEPASMEMSTDGIETLTYIERFFLNQQVIQVKYYYFHFKDGHLVGKEVKIVDRPQSINSDEL
jgi:hypothetical protein